MKFVLVYSFTCRMLSVLLLNLFFVCLCFILGFLVSLWILFCLRGVGCGATRLFASDDGEQGSWGLVGWIGGVVWKSMGCWWLGIRR